MIDADPGGRGRRLLRPRRRQRPGHRAGPDPERVVGSGRAGRLDHHPAAREERAARRSEPRLRPQDQRGRARHPPRAAADEGPDPREVPQHRVLRRRRLRRQAAAETYWASTSRSSTGPGRHARGGHLQPGRLRPDAAPGRPPRPALDRPRAAGGHRQDHERPGLPLRPRAAAGPPVRRGRRSQPSRAATPACRSPRTTSVEEVKQQLLDDPRLGATKAERVRHAVRRRPEDLHDARPARPSGRPQAASRRAAARPTTRASPRRMVAVEPSPARCGPWSAGPASTTYQYDIATQTPGRQTGSSFKTFTLLTAMEQGNLPSDSVGGGGSFANPGARGRPLRASAAEGGIASPSVTSASSQRRVRAARADRRHRQRGRHGGKLGVDVTDLDQHVLVDAARHRGHDPARDGVGLLGHPQRRRAQPAYFVERVEDRDGQGADLRAHPERHPGRSRQHRLQRHPGAAGRTSRAAPAPGPASTARPRRARPAPPSEHRRLVRRLHARTSRPRCGWATRRAACRWATSAGTPRCSAALSRRSSGTTSTSSTTRTADPIDFPRATSRTAAPARCAARARSAAPAPTRAARRARPARSRRSTAPDHADDAQRAARPPRRRRTTTRRSPFPPTTSPVTSPPNGAGG